MKTKTKTNKKLYAEILKTSCLCNKIICRPSQSRETIPLIKGGGGWREGLDYHLMADYLQ